MAAPSVQLEFGRFPLLSDAAAVAICCQQHCNQTNTKTGSILPFPLLFMVETAVMLPLLMERPSR